MTVCSLSQRSAPIRSTIKAKTSLRDGYRSIKENSTDHPEPFSCAWDSGRSRTWMKVWTIRRDQHAPMPTIKSTWKSWSKLSKTRLTSIATIASEREAYSRVCLRQHSAIRLYQITRSNQRRGQTRQSTDLRCATKTQAWLTTRLWHLSQKPNRLNSRCSIIFIMTILDRYLQTKRHQL